jgi:hypothetical protein
MDPTNENPEFSLTMHMSPKITRPGGAYAEEPAGHKIVRPGLPGRWE